MSLPRLCSHYCSAPNHQMTKVLTESQREPSVATCIRHTTELAYYHDFHCKWKPCCQCKHSLTLFIKSIPETKLISLYSWQGSQRCLNMRRDVQMKQSKAITTQLRPLCTLEKSCPNLWLSYMYGGLPTN